MKWRCDGGGGGGERGGSDKSPTRIPSWATRPASARCSSSSGGGSACGMPTDAVVSAGRGRGRRGAAGGGASGARDARDAMDAGDGGDVRVCVALLTAATSERKEGRAGPLSLGVWAWAEVRLSLPQ